MIKYFQLKLKKKKKNKATDNHHKQNIATRGKLK